MPTMEALTLESLTVGYAARHGLRPVASGLSATLPAASLTALIGTNGAGKSTLLRTLSGLQPPLAGTCRWQGTPLSAMSPSRLSRQVAVVLTARPDTAYLTAREAVESGRIPYTSFSGRLSARDRQAVDDALREAGADHLSGRRLSSLSDGERQRVMIAKALAQETPAILLDEPTAFLDFPGKVGVMRLLRRLAHECGKTVLLTTHDLELAFQLADRLWLLTPAGLTEGTPRQLADAGQLDALFRTSGVCFDKSALRFDFRA